MSDDYITLSIQSVEPLNFSFGDKITIFGREYSIRSEISRERVGDDAYNYEVTMYGVIYDLIKTQYRSVGGNGYASSAEFTLTGTLAQFLSLIITNTNRDYPGLWVLDNCPATDQITLDFSKENCLEVLQRVVKEFKKEFTIQQSEMTRTIKIGQFGTVINPPVGTHFQYGKGGSLYSLKLDKLDDKSIITRLWVEGGTTNIKVGYRGYSERLQMPLSRIGDESNRYVEDTVLRDALGGTIEDTVYFDEIFPYRTGSVTALGDTVLEFIDSTMDFDLNEKNEDGSTKYMIAETKPKLTFITGNLAGQEFELSKYDAETHKFTLIKYVDDRNVEFPSEAFPISIGANYKLTDIIMPDTYYSVKEEELYQAGLIELEERKQPRVQYSQKFSPFFVKIYGSGINPFLPGDYLPIRDTRFNIEKNIQIQKISRNLLKEYEYSDITLSDIVSINIIDQTVIDVIDHERTIVRSGIKDTAKARRNTAALNTLKDYLIDPDGEFDQDLITAKRIKALLGEFGTSSGNFLLHTPVPVFLDNYQGNANAFLAPACTLSHLEIKISITVGEGEDVHQEERYEWTITPSATFSALTPASVYYLYAKCSKIITEGTWVLSPTPIASNQEGFYYFPTGTLLPVDIKGTRAFLTTYGKTWINARTIISGRFQSISGNNYFDVDTEQIKMGGFDVNVSEENTTTLQNVKIKGSIIQSGSGAEAPLGVYLGNWYSGIVCFKGDEVTHNGERWMWINATPSGASSPAPYESVYWHKTVAAGEDGQDGAGVEFIFTRNNTGVIPVTPTSITNQDDYVPPGWTDNQVGVTPTMQYEFASRRRGSTGNWGSYSTPGLWARYAADGIDGIDGTDYEFIFTRNNTGAIPATPATSQQDDYVPAGWTDDMQGVTPSLQYEFVSKRNKVEGVWSAFSTAGLWSKYSFDGDDAPVTERRYAKNGSLTVGPTVSDNTALAPAGWSLSVPAVGALEYLWMIECQKNPAKTAMVTVWSDPMRLTGAIGQQGVIGDAGPVVAFRGIFSDTKQYIGNSVRSDAVKYNNLHYRTRVDAGGMIPIGTLPTNETYWVNYGAELESIATNLLLAEGASIGAWFMSGGKIVSTLESGNKITLDASMAQIIIESAVSGGDYSQDTSQGSRIKLDAQNGIIEARSTANTSRVAYMSPSGIFCNNAETLAVSATLGVIKKAAIVGLGYGNVNTSQWDNENWLAGIYGYAYNSGSAPEYGGLFYDLMACGLLFNNKTVDDNSPTSNYIYERHSFVLGLSSGGVWKTMYLPDDGKFGRIIIVKQIGGGGMRFYPIGGQYIYDDSSPNDYYEITHGQMGIFAFVKFMVWRSSEGSMDYQ
ncbi:MAG: phage tail protein [Mangrovibacterium sp.]